MNRTYTNPLAAQTWQERYQGHKPLFACVLGFTATALVPGISAAGATPTHRRHTALADGEFLRFGPQPAPQYPLPPLPGGASPVLISRALLSALDIPVLIFDAGLPEPSPVWTISLGGSPARCLSSGAAMDRTCVEHLFQQGLTWGRQLACRVGKGYLVLGECVVGGTSTALALLTGLGVAAAGRVNSSHPVCNHHQKWQLVSQGLERAKLSRDPLDLVAAVGDPMQVVVAAMTMAASNTCGVLLAGGTQMLAVYALILALADRHTWQPEQVVVGTTRWVAEDPTGDTPGLAAQIPSLTLIATQLSFAQSAYPPLQIYERGYVKEGVGAGGCAIAAHLYRGWSQEQMLETIEALVRKLGEYSPGQNLLF